MTPAKWHTLTLAQQMGNVGSELARARHWEEHHDLKNRQEAFFRALTLIDLTISDQRWTKRRKELTRFREVTCAWFAMLPDYLISPQDLEYYCLQLNLR